VSINAAPSFLRFDTLFRRVGAFGDGLRREREQSGGWVQSQRPTVASIRLAAIRANFDRAEKLAAGREVIAVVKANAYGHGAVAFSRALIGAGCRHLAVFSLDEAVSLRDAGVDVPILVLGGVNGEAEADEAIHRDLVPVVHHEGHARLLASRSAARGKPLRVQVEIDTGMRRMGVACDAAPAFLVGLAADPQLELEGVYSHLACADEQDLAPSLDQIGRFRSVLAEIRERGVAPGMVHIANSAGLLAGEALAKAFPEAGAVRPGLMLYGVSPAPHLDFDRAPVMTLRSRVVGVRRVCAGDSVGYGATHRAERDTRIATLPIGYADGVPISLSNRGRVRLAGRFAEVVGRVSMDFITVDVGESGAAIGDEAILFGDEQGVLPVEDVAAAAGTLAYELLVRIGARVPRIVED
jgi:alanine racemase